MNLKNLLLHWQWYGEFAKLLNNIKVNRKKEEEEEEQDGRI